ncbi:MAG: hypothetical protein IJM53_05710 [Lachnospiraceae bacterium]|nr:hypothetical protein [Lachnospiraceae bacterium]
MKKTLFDYISNDGSSVVFGLPYTEELIGREAQLPNGERVSFGNEPAIKCDDELFLVDMEERILLVEEMEDLSLNALDAEKAARGYNEIPEDLEGWETDLSFASGFVLTALFAEGKLNLKPSPEPEIPATYAEGRKASPTLTQIILQDPITYALEIVTIGDKRYLLHFPETGEMVFFDARRFLLYALMGGRAVTGFVEIPPKE